MPTAPLNTYTVTKLEPYINPEDARQIEVQLGNSLTLAAGTLLGEVTATPGVFAAYNNANVNGTETARVILAHGVTTDASGNITMNGDLGITRKYAPVYYKGTFATGDLVGLDAAAVADLGRLVMGTTTSGILSIG